MRFERPVPNERLRRARHTQGWTQSELAEMLDTDFETISRWERGISVPGAYFREKLCTALQKTAEELGLVPDASEPLVPVTSSYVFIASSYADAESKFVTRLKLTFQAKGVSTLSGRTIRRQGAEHKSRVLQEAIRAAQAVLLIASPEARSSRHVQESLQIARIYRSRVCALLIEGENWQECIPNESGEFLAMIDARGKSDDQVFEEVRAALGEDRQAASAAEEPEKPLPPPRNPYKGLNAFQSEDQRDFFGREAAIGELGAALQATLDAETRGADSVRLLAVVGPSGSGKSSVVLAGLLPRLGAGLLPGSETWLYLDPLLPGAHPLESLTLVLAKHFPARSLKTIRDDLEADTSRGFHLSANQLRTRPEQRVVLFIDQFEEVFTQAIADEDRQHFLDLLVTAATEQHGAAIVMLTLRADFYDRPMHYPAFFERLEASRRILLPLDLKGLREAIEKPAGLPDVQLTFEGNLVGDLVYEMQGQVGALPLLQFTLDQLFERRSDHQLTLQAYRDMGGVRGALARHAESIYASFPSEEHRKMARVLFLRLIDPGPIEQEATRRRAFLTELRLSDPKEAALMEEVVAAFIAARLLTANSMDGVPTVEVSHEAVIREWPRLADWLRYARNDILLQQGISADAAEWLRRGKPVDRLYRETELTEAQAWMERNIPSKDEVEFLQSSLEEQRLQQAAELDRKARELTLQRQVVSRQRILLAVLSLFLIVALILGALAEVGFRQADAQRQLAQTQALIARSRTLAAQANYALLKNQLDRALLLSLKANQTYNTYDARDSLLTALEYSPRMLKMLRTFSSTYVPTGVAIATLAFSPSGQSLASFGLGGAGLLWNTRTGESHSFPIPCLGEATPSTTCLELGGGVDLANILTNGGGVAISPDGQMGAVTGSEGIWIWNVETGTQVATLVESPHCPPPPASPPGPCAERVDFTAIAFSPDGKILASSRCAQYSNGSCSQDRILLWDVSSKKPTSQLLANQVGLAVDLTFSPDGKLLASSNEDGTVSLWDIASRNLTGKIFTGDVDSQGSPNPEAEDTGVRQEEDLAFSPGGKVLASTSSNGAIILWDVASRKPVGSPLASPGGAVQQLAFSPDGRTLAASSDDQSIRLWDVTTGSLVNQPLLGHTQSTVYLAFSPDGKMLASIDRGGTIILWNMATDSLIFQSLQYSNGSQDGRSLLSSAVFSPDGHVIIAGNNSGEILLRDEETGKLVTVLDASIDPLNLPSTTGRQPFDSNALTIESLTFSPDGHTLAAGRFDGMVFLWDWQTRKPLMHFRLEKALRTLTYSPNGHQLASTYDSGDILLTNAVGKIVHTLATHHPSSLPTQMSTAAFSKDGTIVAAGDSNTVVLWDAMTGKRLGQPLQGHTTSVESVAFSPDGNILASSDSSGTTILWDAHTWKIMNKPLSNNDLNFNFNIASAGFAFSPDGSMLASAITEFNGSTTDMFSVTLWNVASQEPIAHAFQDGQDQIADHYAVNSVVFSPDGKQVAILVSSHPYFSHINLWNIDVGFWQTLACSIANRNFTAVEWKQIANGEPYQKVCSGLPADDSVGSDYLNQAHGEVLIGKSQDALSDYMQATHWAIDSGNADVSSVVCRQGSLDQFAKVVLPACEYAVELNSRNVFYRDSRGVARALVGDIKGAIADFSFVVQMANEYGDLSPEQIQERQHWLHELKEGRNPFDVKTLAALQQE